MKFYRVIKSEYLIAESVVDELGLKFLNEIHLERGFSAAVVEAVLERDVDDYYFVTASEIDNDGSQERNVFHDHNGNEYHN